MPRASEGFRDEEAEGHPCVSPGAGGCRLAGAEVLPLLFPALCSAPGTGLASGVRSTNKN